MFTREEIILLKNFCQSVIEKPRPIYEQPHIVKDGCIWCDDWRIIEILKYFFNGEEMYLNDPPPNRLKNNPFWSKSVIIAQAKAILEECKNVDSIIQHLKKRREEPYERSA